MKIGIPKEIKDHEYRVGATPEAVAAFVRHGHEVLVQKRAGEKIGFVDELYEKAGAKMVLTAQEVYLADMIVKVKELQEEEFPLIHEGQILYGYLHLAPDPLQAKRLVERKVVAIAYETVTDARGRLPLLIPMSEIAGRVAIQAGASALQMAAGGKGVLLGGVPGVLPGRVVILGGGVVGTQAAKMALGAGADVTLLDINLSRLRELDDLYGPLLKKLYSSKESMEKAIVGADLVIGAVLIPGKVAPKILSKEMIRRMEKGSVFVDVAIDQGGCSETSRPTSHSYPTYVEQGVIHYCVTNMPGACAKTATKALTHATFHLALEIANKGFEKALRENPFLLQGLNVCKGFITHPGVAQDVGLAYRDPLSLF